MKKGYQMQKIIEDVTKENINIFAFIKIKTFLCRRALKRLKKQISASYKIILVIKTIF